MSNLFGYWKNMVNNGRVRKRARENPTRERLNVVKALGRLGVPYRHMVGFMNPHWHGWKNNMPRAIQWLDFCVYSPKKKRMCVFLFWGLAPGTRGGGKLTGREYQAQLEAKKKFLAEKKIPFFIIPRIYSPQEYQVVIGLHLQRLEAKGGIHESPTVGGPQQANDTREPRQDHSVGAGGARI